MDAEKIWSNNNFCSEFRALPTQTMSPYRSAVNTGPTLTMRLPWPSDLVCTVDWRPMSTTRIKKKKLWKPWRRGTLRISSCTRPRRRRRLSLSFPLLFLAASDPHASRPHLSGGLTAASHRITGAEIQHRVVDLVSSLAGKVVVIGILVWIRFPPHCCLPGANLSSPHCSVNCRFVSAWWSLES